MRHNIRIQLLGSAGLAVLCGLWLGWPPGRIGVAFVSTTAVWGCVTSSGDAWHRWQTHGNPLLGLALLWNIGLAALVWFLHARRWGFFPGLLVVLAYTVLPWGLGRLGWGMVKRWRSTTQSKA